VAPILKKLGISGLVATDLDKHTGKITGHFANYGFKVTEFRKKYNLDDIDEFYSDAWSDHYIAKYAKKAYLVHDGGQRTEWNKYFSTHPKILMVHAINIGHGVGVVATLAGICLLAYPLLRKKRKTAEQES
jgi:phosphoserine phosphatase